MAVGIAMGATPISAVARRALIIHSVPLRNAIPGDITAGLNPDPGSWGKPMSYFALGTAECSANHFGMHNIVINTTFCGDWAGNVYKGADGRTGWSACTDYVKNNPSQFTNAYWDIKYVHVFSKP
jgi:hypothetical protein